MMSMSRWIDWLLRQRFDEPLCMAIAYQTALETLTIETTEPEIELSFARLRDNLPLNLASAGLVTFDL